MTQFSFVPDPAGITAISRWLSGATPPETSRPTAYSIPKGSQRIGAGIPPGCKPHVALATGGGAALTTG